MQHRPYHEGAHPRSRQQTQCIFRAGGVPAWRPQYLRSMLDQVRGGRAYTTFDPVDERHYILTCRNLLHAQQPPRGDQDEDAAAGRATSCWDLQKVFERTFELAMSKRSRLTGMVVPCCRHYRNIFHAASTIVKNEGVLSLQKGLGPALVSDRAFTKNMPFTKQESSTPPGSSCLCAASVFPRRAADIPVRHERRAAGHVPELRQQWVHEE